MAETYYMIIAPQGLRDVFLAERARLRESNPGLDVQETASRRGPVQDAIAIAGDLATLTGLITFVDWCVGKVWRNHRHTGTGESLEFTVIGLDEQPRTVCIAPDDDGEAIRRRIRQALDAEED